MSLPDRIRGSRQGLCSGSAGRNDCRVIPGEAVRRATAKPVMFDQIEFIIMGEIFLPANKFRIPRSVSTIEPPAAVPKTTPARRINIRRAEVRHLHKPSWLLPPHNGWLRSCAGHPFDPCMPADQNPLPGTKNCMDIYQYSDPGGRAAPDLPDSRASQFSAKVSPRGVMTPIPVMTTLLISGNSWGGTKGLPQAVQ